MRVGVSKTKILLNLPWEARNELYNLLRVTLSLPTSLDCGQKLPFHSFADSAWFQKNKNSTKIYVFVTPSLNLVFS